MKLVYLSTARIPDDWGHVIQILKMCEAFADVGHTVELVVPYRLSTRSEDSYAYVGAKRNFRITKLPCIDLSARGEGKMLYWLRTLSFLVCAKAYLLFRNYDVLYTREPSAALLFNNFIFEAHSVSPGLKNALARARAVVAITSFIKEELAALGFPKERILVAGDAVAMRDFAKTESKEEARVRLNLPQDKKLALYLGRLDAWKGTDILFETAPLLDSDVQLVIIGAEPAEVESLRTAHPGSIFIPFQPYRDVAKNQAVADVLLLPNTAKNPMSERYTSPLKLFTYMASGIPIVASDIPSIREILSDENAFLVAPDSPEALAEGIRHALADPSESKQRAQAARTKVGAYTWEARAHVITTSILA